MLRMIEGYIGPEHYKQGVRTYLKRHTYDCARSYHLWDAFEDAAVTPITAMVQNWIEQPGYPLITVERNGNKLTLTQQRFTYRPYNSSQTWIVPITLMVWGTDAEPDRQTFIMQDAEMTVELPQAHSAYKLNIDQTGFYRVNYLDPDNLHALADRVKNGSLAHTDRWGLQNDLYALARAGRLPLEAYLDFIDHYENESEYLPLAGIVTNLGQAERIVTTKTRDRIAAIGRSIGQRVLARIGMTPEANEPHARAALRNQLLWQTAAWGSASAIDFGLEQFDRMRSGHNVDPDIAHSIMQIGARQSGQPALDWFKTRFAESPSEHERMNILAAIAAFAQWHLVKASLEFTLNSVPPRNRFMPIVSAAANRPAASRLWDWYQAHLPQVEALHPLHYERIITDIIPVAGLDRTEEVNAFFNTYIRQKPLHTDTIDLALENLDINATMRSAN
jgi:tricorn protease interacting factor F2/3